MTTTLTEALRAVEQLIRDDLVLLPRVGPDEHVRTELKALECARGQLQAVVRHRAVYDPAAPQPD